jgi:hypothetical protein
VIDCDDLSRQCSKQGPDACRKRAMASAPRNVTRVAPTVTLAPPTRAANPPSIARNTSEVPETTGIKLDSELMATASSGVTAPTAKLAADVNAA